MLNMKRRSHVLRHVTQRIVESRNCGKVLNRQNFIDQAVRVKSRDKVMWGKIMGGRGVEENIDNFLSQA